jgi:hypothetical protein
MIVGVLNSEAYSEPVSLRILCLGTVGMSVWIIEMPKSA